jgi:hypothetical protein
VLGICACRDGLASRPQSVVCIRTARLPKTLPHSAPMPSRVPALRQPIPGVTQGLCFLGHPTPSGLTAWSPAPVSPERAPDGFPCSVCPFSVTLGWYYTPCPTYRVKTTYRFNMWPNGDNSLFGACLSTVLAGSNSRRFAHTFVAYP